MSINHLGPRSVMERLVNHVGQFAEESLPLVVTGDSGGGKSSLLAQLVHNNPSASFGPGVTTAFVFVGCSSASARLRKRRWP